MASARIKKYKCFTEEQQKYYEGLTEKQRRYVDMVGQGQNKSDAYRMAGFNGKRSAQAAYMLEVRNPMIKEISEVLANNRRAEGLTKEGSEINKKIDALANQQNTEIMLATIDNADGETAKRIQFYRDIMRGKIVTKKIVKKYDKENRLVGKTETLIDDVETKMKARKALDNLLGLNAVLDLDTLECGDITINIVDASKREAKEDSRNDIDFNSKDFGEVEDEGEPIDAEPIIEDSDK